MATFVPNAKFSSHSRSISLPSSSHPLIASAEQHLNRLRSSEGASSSSHASVCQKLDGLKNLYECLDDVLQLPVTQQLLSNERSGKWEEEVLDGSLRVLDICGTAKDIYSQMKENVQDLESSLRRRANEVDTYMISKKKLNKMICKCLKELKRAEKICTLAVGNKDGETTGPLIKLITEVQEVSLKMLGSTISVIAQPKAGWSLVSKLLQLKGASNEGDSDIAGNGIEKIEVELLLLNKKKSNKDSDLLQMQNTLKRLEALDLSIQELTELLEVIFRALLKTRVSLLNILNH